MLFLGYKHFNEFNTADWVAFAGLIIGLIGAVFIGKILYSM